MPKITESRPALTVRVEDADVYECGPDMNVFSWSPSPPGTANAKCTQVHLVVGSAAPRMLVRFKGSETLDALIDALTSHRVDVFGRRPS